MKDNNVKQIKIHPPRRSGWMELALLIFSGSLDFKVELNHLRTTVKKMQHDSTKIFLFDQNKTLLLF